jgi:hypothetical protein
VLAFIRGEIKLTPIYRLRRQDEDPFLPFTAAWLDSVPLVKAPTHNHGMHGRWSLFSRNLCGIGSWGDGDLVVAPLIDARHDPALQIFFGLLTLACQLAHLETLFLLAGLCSSAQI